MRPPLQRVRVVRPFEHAGRIYGTGERVTVESALADELRQAGYVLPLVSGEPVLLQASEKWLQPTTR